MNHNFGDFFGSFDTSDNGFVTTPFTNSQPNSPQFASTLDNSSNDDPVFSALNDFVYQPEAFGQGHWSDDEDHNTLVFNTPEDPFGMSEWPDHQPDFLYDELPVSPYRNNDIATSPVQLPSSPYRNSGPIYAPPPLNLNHGPMNAPTSIIDDTIFSYISAYHQNDDDLYDEYRNLISFISQKLCIDDSTPNVKTIYEIILTDYDNSFIPNNEADLDQYCRHLSSILDAY